MPDSPGFVPSKSVSRQTALILMNVHSLVAAIDLGTLTRNGRCRAEARRYSATPRN
jgi:hypothetical protein